MDSKLMIIFCLVSLCSAAKLGSRFPHHHQDHHDFQHRKTGAEILFPSQFRDSPQTLAEFDVSTPDAFDFFRSDVKFTPSFEFSEDAESSATGDKLDLEFRASESDSSCSVVTSTSYLRRTEYSTHTSTVFQTLTTTKVYPAASSYSPVIITVTDTFSKTVFKTRANTAISTVTVSKTELIPAVAVSVTTVSTVLETSFRPSQYYLTQTNIVMFTSTKYNTITETSTEAVTKYEHITETAYFKPEPVTLPIKSETTVLSPRFNQVPGALSYIINTERVTKTVAATQSLSPQTTVFTTFILVPKFTTLYSTVYSTSTRTLPTVSVATETVTHSKYVTEIVGKIFPIVETETATKTQTEIVTKLVQGTVHFAVTSTQVIPVYTSITIPAYHTEVRLVTIPAVTKTVFATLTTVDTQVETSVVRGTTPIVFITTTSLIGCTRK